MTVFLVRHADAGIRGGGDGPDEMRVLDANGRRQAERIAELIGDAPLDRVLSSWYPRCRQTLEPLAAAHGLLVEDHPALAEGTDPAEALRLIASLRAGALCSHGDVIGGAIMLLADDGVPLDGGQRWKKASVWALETRDGRIVSGRYVPPPQ